MARLQADQDHRQQRTACITLFTPASAALEAEKLVALPVLLSAHLVGRGRLSIGSMTPTHEAMPATVAAEVPCSS